MGLPPAMTVHVPHCPSPHPNFGPSSPRSFLRTYSSGLVGLLALLVLMTADVRTKKQLRQQSWTLSKRLPKSQIILKHRFLAFSPPLHAGMRKTNYTPKTRYLLINRRSLLLSLRLL